METHFVDQYIRNKKKTENNSNSNSNLSSSPVEQNTNYNMPSSSYTRAPSTSATSTAGGGYYSSSYQQQQQQNPTTNRPASVASASAASQHGHGGGYVSQAAHHVLMTAAQKAQQEVDHVQDVAAEIALREEASERVERQYSLLSERVDTATLQVAASEDKVINVTKMLKMLQQLSEDREKALRDETGDLRGKFKKLERQLEQERETREKMSESMTTYIRETVERALEKQQLSLRADFTRQIDTMDTSLRNVTRTTEELKSDVDEVRRTSDKFSSVLREVENFCSRFAEDLRSSTKTLVDSRLEEFRFRQDASTQKVDDLKGKVEDVHDRLTESVTSQHELRRSLEDIKRRSDPLKEWVEGVVATMKTETRDTVTKETDTMRQHMHVALANTSQCIEGNEAGINELREELDKVSGAVRGTIKNVDAHNEKATDNIQDLREITQQSRDLLANQLEATKDWASRNILRLKKHLDLAVSDMAATRQAQLEIQVQFQRLTQAHNDEKNALLQQLNFKTKEASLLTQAVDKEVAEVAQMMTDFEETRRHSQMKRQAKDELKMLSTMA